MSSRAITEGWEYVTGLSGANTGALAGEKYVNALDEAINKLSDALNSKKGYLSDPSRLKGFVAEDWHAGTFNINAALRSSNDRAFVEGSVQHASVDVSTTFGQNYSMKYYATAHGSVLSQAKDIYQAYYEYLGKSKTDTPMTFEQYLSKNGYSGNQAELLQSVYNGQGRIIPQDQLNEAIKFLQEKIASESMKDGANRAAVLAKYEETLSMLSDRIKNQNGVESIPLSKAEAEAIAGLCKEGKFDPRDFGISLESLISREYMLQQALKSGCTAALLTVIFQIAPDIFKAFMYLIKTGEIDVESLKSAGRKVIPAAAEGFLRGAIAASLTIAAQAGKFGPAFTNIDAGVVGAVVFLALDTVKNSFLVATGKMTPKEMGGIFIEQTIVSAGSVAGGILGQALVPAFSFVSYMLGSLVGGLIASVIVFAGKKLLGLSLDSGIPGFSLVEQNYELPPALLEQLGYVISQLEKVEYESLNYETVQYETFQNDSVNLRNLQDEDIVFKPLRRGIIGFNTVGYVW